MTIYRTFILLLLAITPALSHAAQPRIADDSLRRLEKELDKAKKDLRKARNDKQLATLRHDADSLTALLSRLTAAYRADSLTADSLRRRAERVDDRLLRINRQAEVLSAALLEKADKSFTLSLAQTDTAALAALVDDCRHYAAISPQLGRQVERLTQLSRHAAIFRSIRLPDRAVDADSMRRLTDCIDRLADVHPAGRAEVDSLRHEADSYLRACTALHRFIRTVNGDEFISDLRSVKDYKGAYATLDEQRKASTGEISAAYAACQSAVNAVPALQRALGDYLRETATAFPTPTEKILTTYP